MAYQTPEMPDRPKTPTPKSNVFQVQTYLSDLFYYFDFQRNRAEAEEKAAKIKVDGSEIFTMSEEEWRALYGIQGGFIYRELQQSKFGYVSYPSKERKAPFKREES